MAEHYDREHKNMVRERMMRDLPAARSLLTMPSSRALCVRQMLDLEIVDETTTMTWVEIDPAKINPMRDTAAAMGVSPSIVLGDIRNYQPTQTIDLLNLDTEGGFSPGIGTWLEAIQPYLDERSHLLLTFTKHSRNRLPARFAKWFDETYLDGRLSVVRDHVVSRLIHHNLPLARAMILLACALPRFVVSVHCADEYADGQPMIAFWASLRPRQGPSPLPSFTSIVAEFMPGYEPPRWTRGVDDPTIHKSAAHDRMGAEDILMVNTRKIDYQRRGHAAQATRKINQIERLREEQDRLAQRQKDIDAQIAKLLGEAQEQAAKAKHCNSRLRGHKAADTRARAGQPAL